MTIEISYQHFTIGDKNVINNYFQIYYFLASLNQ
jgi:hypothetical protein